MCDCVTALLSTNTPVNTLIHTSEFNSNKQVKTKEPQILLTVFFKNLYGELICLFYSIYF